MTRERAKDSLAEAHDDGEFARYALAGGFFAKACYVGARYPDMLTEGHPSGAFDRIQAEEAIAYAQKFLSAAKAELEP